MKSSVKKFLRSFFQTKPTNGLKDRSWLEKIRNPSYQKWFIGIGTALLLMLLLSPSLQLPLKDYHVGDIATREIKSSQDLLVEDEKSTQEKRLEAERSVLLVYDYDTGALRDAESRVRSTFETLATLLQKPEKGTDLDALLKKEWEASFRFFPTQREWQRLEKERFPSSIGEAALKLITPALKKGVINDKELLDQEIEKGMVLRNIQTREEKRILSPLTFLDIKEAKTKLRSQAISPSPLLGKEWNPLILKIGESLLRPNLTFNKSETEDRKKKTREKVNPVYFQVKRGEGILRAGERVQEEHLPILQALKRAQERSHLISVLIGLGLLTFLLLASLYE